MTRAEILKAVAMREDCSTAQVARIVSSFFEVMQISLAAGEDVKLSNFGKFEVRYLKPVERRNPMNGEPVHVPAKTSVGFKPAPALKERLNS